MRGSLAILAGMWFEQMHPGWRTALAEQQVLLEQLEAQLALEPALAPKTNLVMAAFEADPERIRVVIVGQDPYPTPDLAVGHSFAVGPGVRIPASLRNIFAELLSDLNADPQGLPNPSLSAWQSQGVMMLNRSLTTLEGQAGAHSRLGWVDFTRAAVEHLIGRNQPLVLVLWGAQAQGLKRELAQTLATASGRVAVIEGVHPSPLSAHRGFFGSRPFSAVNTALVEMGAQPIDWLQN